MRKILFFIQLVLLPCILVAQNGTKVLTGNGLGEFGNIPVNHFIGLPNISIPLFTLKKGDIEVPVSLVYNPTAVKPNEPQSWAGLGWDISGGGKITRSVYSGVDEHAFESESTTVFERVYGTGTEDLFYFNFMGYSGMFEYDYDENCYTSEGWKVYSKDNIKVEVYSVHAKEQMRTNFQSRALITSHEDDVKTQQILGFRLTTPDGVQYVFGGSYDAIEFVYGYNPSTTPVGVRAIVNTWHLKEIFNPQSQTTITFSYTYGSPIEHLRLKREDLSYKFVYKNLRDEEKELPGGGHTTNYSEKTGFIQLPVYISKVCTFCGTFGDKGDKVEFIKDSYGKLSKVQFVSDINSNVTNYTFNYTPPSGVIIPNNQRFALFSLSYNSSSGELYNYKFEYNNLDIGDFGGDKIDHWGYFNNYSFESSGSPLLPNAAVLTNGLLNKIVYPTKGYTNLLWEPNDYAKMANESALLSTAGGARISQIINKDYSDNLINSKSYIYKLNYQKGGKTSSGILGNIPTYSINSAENSLFYRVSGIGSPYKSLIYSYSSYTGFNIITNGQSHIGYSEIVETNLDGDYTIYKYTNFGQDACGLHELKSGSSPTPELGKLYDISRYNTNDIKIFHKSYTYTPPNYEMKMEKVETFLSFYAVKASFDYGDYFFSNVIGTHSKYIFTYPFNITGETTEVYDNNGIETEMDQKYFEYSNTNSVTSINTMKSDGSSISNVLVYPSDIAKKFEHYPSFIDEMISQNLVVPILKIKAIVVVADDYSSATFEILDAEYTEYYSTPFVLPKKSYQLDKFETNTINLDDYPVEVSSTADVLLDAFLKSDPAELLHDTFDPTLLMHSTSEYTYNSAGNLERYQKDKENPIYFIWNQYTQFPVAKILVPHDIVIPEALKSDILFDSDIYSDIDDGLTVISSYIQQLRSEITTQIGDNACQLYTYTFKGFEGVTSETDPNGITTYYKYDNAGRLLYVMDKDGNYLSSYNYHYKGQ